MRRHWQARSGSRDLTLVFAGWGLGAVSFAGLRGDEDVLILDDYTRLDDLVPETADYDNVRMLAYSFGVASAAHWLGVSGLRPTCLIGVNGTLFPSDATKGIAPAIIAATADGLDPARFAQFCRRAGLVGPVPHIDLASTQTELGAIARRGSAPQIAFDRIWISQRDRIIPTKAQKTAWQSQVERVRHLDAPHHPFAVGQSWQDWFL